MQDRIDNVNVLELQSVRLASKHLLLGTNISLLLPLIWLTLQRVLQEGHTTAGGPLLASSGMVFLAV